MQAVNNQIEIVVLNGIRFDCGGIEGYVKVIKLLASHYDFNRRFLKIII